MYGLNYLRTEPSYKISRRSGIIKPLKLSKSAIIAPLTLISNGELECKL